MSAELLIEIGRQIMLLGGLALAGGVITSGFTEVLKFEFLHAPAAKNPQLAAAIISFVLSAIAVFSLGAVALDTWVSWIVVSGATLFTAFKSYDWILKGLYEKIRSNN